MKLLYDYSVAPWAVERSRWTKFFAVIGYPRGQDGALLPARDYPLCPQGKLPPKPYNREIKHDVKANGKSCRLFLAVCSVEWKYLYLRWIVEDICLFLCGNVVCYWLFSLELVVNLCPLPSAAVLINPLLAKLVRSRWMDNACLSVFIQPSVY